jgi:hypothetical protein
MKAAGTTHEECRAMKYMLMIYNRPGFLEDLTEAERTDLFDQVDAVMKELTESGELVGGEALADPSNTRTVKVRDGVQSITDGPYMEAKEQFAGFLTVECETPERATEIAARWPDARYAAMEVRPVMNQSGTEM